MILSKKRSMTLSSKKLAQAISRQKKRERAAKKIKVKDKLFKFLERGNPDMVSASRSQLKKKKLRKSIYRTFDKSRTYPPDMVLKYGKRKVKPLRRSKGFAATRGDDLDYSNFKRRALSTPAAKRMLKRRAAFRRDGR